MDFQFVRTNFWKNFNLLRIQDIFLKIMDSIKFYALNNQFLMDFYFWKSVFSWISCLGYLNLIGIPFWEMYYLMNFPIRVFNGFPILEIYIFNQFPVQEIAKILIGNPAPFHLIYFNWPTTLSQTWVSLKDLLHDKKWLP